MTSSDILAFISALGGMEAIKWGLNWLVNRKTEARRSEAGVNSLENENHKEQTEKQEWINRCHEAEITCKELEAKRCFIRGCPNRQPPSEY